MLSRRGLVYACRSIDTATVFAPNAESALSVFDAVNSFDELDPLALPAMPTTGPSIQDKVPRIAVPRAQDLRFFGNVETEAFFAQATAHASKLFGNVSDVDFTPFTDLNDQMFFGPLLAERDVSIGSFVDENQDATNPTVRSIVETSRNMTAAEAYRAQYKVADTKTATANFWRQFDILMVPTVGTVLTKADLEADPLGPNFNNGYYTNYANPLGLSAIATPYAKTHDGVPWGVTFLINEPNIAWLAKLADKFSATAQH